MGVESELMASHGRIKHELAPPRVAASNRTRKGVFIPRVVKDGESFESHSERDKKGAKAKKIRLLKTKRN